MCTDAGRGRSRDAFSNIVGTVGNQLARLARRQHGAFTRAQALEHHSRRTFERRVADGSYRRVLPGTYCDGSMPDTVTLTVAAAVLYAGPGAVLSHTTAAAVHGIDVGAQSVIHLTVPYGRVVTDQHGIRVHRSRKLGGAAMTTRTRFPATSPVRTLIDLAGVMPRPALDAAVADAVRRGLVSAAYLRTQLDGFTGRHEARAVRQLLADFDPLLESVLEREYAALVTGAGLPLGTAQHEIWDGSVLIARVDFAYADRRLVVEIDGYAHHASLEQFAWDRRRQRALAARGWEVVRFVADDIRRRPAELVSELRTLLERAHRGVV